MRALHFVLVQMGNIPIFIAYLSVRVAAHFSRTARAERSRVLKDTQRRPT